MERQIRILGIAPYEGMKSLMEDVAQEYPQAEMTLFVGDLEQGVAVAKENFHGNYDVVISRGGTARMLQENISLPVVEIEISFYDILCAIRLADAVSGKAALISYTDSGRDVRSLCDLMGYDIDIYTLESREQADIVLETVRSKDYSVLLCDVIANTTAQRLGLNSVLITSGRESIRKAFARAISLCRSRSRLREENLFFRELMGSQFGETVLFENDGTLYFSTIPDVGPDLSAMLRQEMENTVMGEDRRITRVLHGMLYSLRARRMVLNEKEYVGFFFTYRKSPLPAGQTGIRYYTRPESEKEFLDNIFSFSGILQDYQEQIDQINRSRMPVLISGEDGTGKETVAHILYTRGQQKSRSLVCIDCNQLTAKSQNFLLEHHASPLADEGNVLYFSNIDVLSEERMRQFMAVMKDMEVCRRNRVIFSCVCAPGERISSTGRLLADELCCLSFFLSPLRSLVPRIPAFVNVAISRLNAAEGGRVVGIEPEAMDLLCRFSWPHNFVQFRRVMVDLVTASPTPILTVAHVNATLRRERHTGSFDSAVENGAAPLDLNRKLEDINRDIAIRVVAETGGNQTAAAKILGISRTTLWRLLKKE